MCIVVTPAGHSHYWNQLFIGVIVGCAAGYAHGVGFYSLANLLTTLLLILTILDHLGVILVPWGYRGPGTEPGRFRGGAITVDQLGYEFLNFLINNCVLYVTYAVFYALSSGHLIITKEGRVVWM